MSIEMRVILQGGHGSHLENSIVYVMTALCMSAGLSPQWKRILVRFGGRRTPPLPR